MKATVGAGLALLGGTFAMLCMYLMPVTSEPQVMLGLSIIGLGVAMGGFSVLRKALR